MSARPLWSSTRPLRVLGTGRALPGPAISTEELLDRIEGRFGVPVGRRGRQIAGKLGIASRHIARDFDAAVEAPRPGAGNVDLAAAALTAALDRAGVRPEALSYVIGHTATPARPVPSNTAFVADRLGLACPYMELRQACTGFANALTVASGLLLEPGAGPVAIVGSEVGSVFFDPRRCESDEGQVVNLVQMGDGAAAVILARDDGGAGARLTHIFHGQAGAGRPPGFSLAEGGSDTPWHAGAVGEFGHDFQEVRRSGPELFFHDLEAAGRLGIDIGAVDRLLPHQANGRLAAMMHDALGIDPGRVFVNADRLGNTGSAAIWLGLSDLVETLMPGQTVLAMGAEATKYMFGGFLYQHG